MYYRYQPKKWKENMEKPDQELTANFLELQEDSPWASLQQCFKLKIDMVVIWRLSPLCKVVPISESRKFLPACEIRNPGLWNPVACVHTPLPTPIFPEGKRGSVHRLKSGIKSTIKSVQISGDTFQKDWSPEAVNGDSLRGQWHVFCSKHEKPHLESLPSVLAWIVL